MKSNTNTSNIKSKIFKLVKLLKDSNFKNVYEDDAQCHQLAIEKRN